MGWQEGPYPSSPHLPLHTKGSFLGTWVGQINPPGLPLDRITNPGQYNLLNKTPLAAFFPSDLLTVQWSCLGSPLHQPPAPKFLSPSLLLKSPN